MNTAASYERLVIVGLMDGVPLDEELRSLPPELRSRIRYLPEVGSTNDDALAWALEGAPNGSVVVTDHQTAGRGRWGRKWESARGKLLQSSTILVDPVDVRTAGLVSTAAGVACARAIEAASGITTQLKWPNDVLLEGLKVSGMLIETQVDADRISLAIVGIGINTGWTSEEIPGDLRGRATSIRIACEREGHPSPSRAEVLAALMTELDRAADLLRSGRSEDLLHEARTRSSVLGNEVVVRSSDGSTLGGRAVDLADDGSLLLEVGRDVLSVSVAEVERVLPAS